ncbi:MAG: DUF721 domain-containing protein [Flavobacteriales bacterium]|nr:DUF721 domain-containing protein [Flavobacteriales bacterium]
MKRTNEQWLAEAIARLIDGAGMRDRLQSLDIKAWWPELAGPMIARHTTAITLRAGRLTIAVDSAPLRQELTFMRAEIAARINERAGKDVVSEVLVR